MAIGIKYPWPRECFSNIIEPYFANLGVIAASHCYETDFVPEFAARWIEPASARVTVLDAAGRPLHAVVEIGWRRDAKISGSTDDNGQILFTGLMVPNNPYELICASIPGNESADILANDYRRPADAPVPPDEKLQNRLEIFPCPLAITRDAETSFTLRQERVAYVTGKILADEHDDLKAFSVIVDPSLNQPYAYAYVRKSTKEFAAGPFRPGRLCLILIRTNDKGGEIRSLVPVTARWRSDPFGPDSTRPPPRIGTDTPNC